MPDGVPTVLLDPDDLKRSQELRLINSLRSWRRAVLVQGEASS